MLGLAVRTVTTRLHTVNQNWYANLSYGWQYSVIYHTHYLIPEVLKFGTGDVNVWPLTT